MAAKVPTHVSTSWDPSVTVDVLAFTYHACSLPLKTLALLGLGVSNGYLLVLDPNLYYTHHMHFHWSGLTYIWVSTHTFLGPTYVAIISTRPLSWPAPHKCRCPITWAPNPTLWSNTLSFTTLIIIYFTILIKLFNIFLF